MNFLCQISALKKGKFKLLTFQILNSNAETHGAKSAYILTLLELTHLKFDAKVWGQRIQVFGALCKKNNAMLMLIVSCDAKWGALLSWGLSQFSLKQYMTFVLFVVCSRPADQRISQIKVESQNSAKIKHNLRSLCLFPLCEGNPSLDWTAKIMWTDGWKISPFTARKKKKTKAAESQAGRKKCSAPGGMLTQNLYHQYLIAGLTNGLTQEFSPSSH